MPRIVSSVGRPQFAQLASPTVTCPGNRSDDPWITDQVDCRSTNALSGHRRPGPPMRRVAEERRSTRGAEPPVGDRAGEEIGITREHEPAAPALSTGKTAIVLGGRFESGIAGLDRGGDGMKRRVGRHDDLSRTCACDGNSVHALEEPLVGGSVGGLVSTPEEPEHENSDDCDSDNEHRKLRFCAGQNSRREPALATKSKHTLVNEYSAIDFHK